MMSESTEPPQSASQHNPVVNIELSSTATSTHGSTHGTTAGSNISDEDKEKSRLLKIRKKQELKLVKKFDKSKINVSKECFFLIDSDWLNAWAAFVNGDETEDPPGPLSTAQLLDSKQNPLPNLQAIRDYRGVPPIVYFIFVELYGKDSSPEIARYVVDIYKVPVSVAKMVNIQVTARSEAKIHVNRVRPKWIKWEREYEDDEEEPFGLCGGWCCGLSKEHLEAFIYWAIMCWATSRRKSGRADISYRKYRPLRPDEVAQEEEAAAEAKHAQQEMDREAGDENPAWLAARRAAEAKKEAAAAAQGAQGEPATVPGKKTAQSAGKKPPRRKGSSAAAAKASQELARTRHVLHQRETNGNDSEGSGSSTDSDAEELYMLQSAPADKDHEKGTWLSATKWYGFGR